MTLPVNSIVILDIDPRFGYESYIDSYEKLLNVKNKVDHILCLGEIVNMEGHVSIITKDGRIVWGLHAEAFRLVNENEI